MTCRSRRLNRFNADNRGNVALTFALLIPVIIGFLGLSVDFVVWSNQKQELQAIADEAALAAAKHLYLADATSTQADQVAQSTATRQMTRAGMLGGGGSGNRGSGGSRGGSADSANQTTFGGAYGIKTRVDIEAATVEVVIRQAGAVFFSKAFIAPPVIRVNAVARAVGGGRICVLALETGAAEAVSVKHTAAIQARRCGVFSNSVHKKGIAKGTAAEISAELICSAGGYNGGLSKTRPEPVTDCPAVPDPLADREPPAVGSCDYHDVVRTAITPVRITLSPGVYCGGLALRGPVKAWLEPGLYVMKDGPLITTLWAELRGENVGIYFSGDKSTFNFSVEGKVELTAPADGPMAGILFFEDRAAAPLRKFEICSDEARVLLGTIYLPNGILVVATPSPIADLSAYTAIVVRRLQLAQNPTLVLNANYSATNVPVPDGINRVGGNIILAK